MQSIATCSLVHVGIWDMNGTRFYDGSVMLRHDDNFGIVVQAGGAGILLNDYSDTAFGGSNFLPDVASGNSAPFSVPVDSDGLMRGFMTFVQTNTGCAGAGGAPSGNISGTYAIVADNLFVRSAIINSYKDAFAINGTMLQGFGNSGNTFSENDDFINSTSAPNMGVACDFNGNGTYTDVFGSLDDNFGAEIDFRELFLTDNITPTPPYFICDAGNKFYPALGSYDGQYWVRFNNNPAVGTTSKLVLVAPLSNMPEATRFPRSLVVWSFNDDSSYIPWGPTSINVVSAIPFGGSGISIGSTAGEALLFITAPVFGFAYTETASLADVYPIVRTGAYIEVANKTLVDGTVDIITLP